MTRSSSRPKRSNIFKDIPAFIIWPSVVIFTILCTLGLYFMIKIVTTVDDPIHILENRILINGEYWLEGMEVIEQYRVSDEAIFVHIKIPKEKTQKMITQNVRKACDKDYVKYRIWYRGYVCSDPIWYMHKGHWLGRYGDNSSGREVWCTADWYVYNTGEPDNLRNELCVNPATGDLSYQTVLNL